MVGGEELGDGEGEPVTAEAGLDTEDGEAHGDVGGVVAEVDGEG